MNDVGQLLFAVFIHIVHAKSFSQQHIDLDGYDSILLAEYIVELDIQLRSVEGCFIDADFIVYAQVIQNFAHYSLCMLPLLSSALVFIVRVSRVPLAEAEGAFIQHANGIEHIFCQVQAALEFFFQLVRTQNQMALGNGELAHTDEAVHFAAVLVTEQGGGFA